MEQGLGGLGGNEPKECMSGRGDTYVVLYISDSEYAKSICFVRRLRVSRMHSTMWLWSTLYASRCALGSLSSVTIWAPLQKLYL